jgi:hypothetical protein
MMFNEIGLKARQSAPSWRHLLLWEIAWLGVEATCVALGLWLMLGLGAIEIGGLVLLSFVCLDFAVRWRHYAAFRMHDEGGGTRR